MNLKQILLEELSNHLEWDLFTQARFLYLRTCAMFAYDWQYFYLDKEKRLEIYHLKQDIENILTTDIICSTWCYMYIDLLHEIGVEAWIEMTSTLHCYVFFKIDGMIYKADATKGFDFSRVKMGCSTNGFTSLLPDFSLPKKLLESDVVLGYKEKQYADEAIKNIKHNLALEGYNKNEDPRKPMDIQQFLYKVDLIQSMINNKDEVQKFFDTDYFLSYLGRNILTPVEKNELLVQTYWNVTDYPGIVDFFVIRDENLRKVYLLKDRNGKYYFEEASKEDIDFYTSNYTGKFADLIRELKP